MSDQPMPPGDGADFETAQMGKGGDSAGTAMEFLGEKVPMRGLGWSAVTVVSILLGCSDAPDSSRRAEPEGTVSEVISSEEHRPLQLNESQLSGQAVFNTVCWTCHGPSGRGDGPAVQAGVVDQPPDFLLAEYADLTPDAITRRFGFLYDRPDEAHPYMQYMASVLKEEAFLSALAFVPALAYPREIPGSLLAGQAMYATSCQACHGKLGRGDGIAAHLNMTTPADFTTDTLIANRDFDAVFQRIHTGGGSSMPPWGVALSEGEIWNLVAYVSSFQPVLDPPIWILGR